MENQKDEFENMAEEIQINYSVGRVSAEDSLTCCEITAIADALRKVHNDAINIVSMKISSEEIQTKYRSPENIAAQINKLKKD